MQQFFLAYLLGTLLAAAPCVGTELQRFETSQIHMGTSFGIVLYAADEPTAIRAFRAAFDRVRQLENVTSDYDPDSEIMVVCRTSPTSSPLPVSADLCRVLSASQELSRRTEGAFDVTVGPLSKLWRRARRRQQMPATERLRAARDSVGYQHLRVDAERCTVELLRRGMRIDLGGIAKGFAADEALAVLREMGVQHALINAGGDIAVGDGPPDKPAWVIGIAPLKAKGPPSHFLHLTNAAVATSGDTWQYVEIDGQRYSHILDPRTGLGVTARSSVSVVAGTGMAADGLASAVSVLGVEEGLTLVEETPGTAALIIRIEDGAAKTHSSRRLPAFLAPRYTAPGRK